MPAAIPFNHRHAGYFWCSADLAITSVMHCILRQQRKPVRPTAALTSEELCTLRAGFITEAYLNGALDEQVAGHARQSDLETTRGYRRRAKVIAATPTKLVNL